ncbi:MAG TPA: alpha/beta hydrolase [Solirubrobacteraceae bacterium]|nr:alpha/beta hydrolase [Solirubrobacteraceae bacterium]
MQQPQMPDVPGVSHRDVIVRGVRMHVAEAGDGPPLLLLHGWPQHWWSWRRLIPELAREYRVLVPDLRGWGWSDAPPGRYAKAEWVEDVVALLDAEGIGRARVIGHDWGGWVSFLLALAHPERVERLVTLDIPPPWRGRPRPRDLLLPVFMAYQLLVGCPGLGPRTMTSGRGFVRAMIRGGSARRAHWADEELDVYADVLRVRARAEASSRCYRTFLTREMPAMLRRGDRSQELLVPTLLLMGAASPLKRALDPRPSRNLRVESVPGAGHFLPEEAPEAVLERALPFLAER